MCENQSMEKKNEDLVVVHSQHARILKEEDEIWISSEDLNTENSSDDEKSRSKLAYKKKLKLKHRKRSSPNIKVQRPSIPSIPSTSRAVDERLLMPKPEDTHSRSDDSRTSDEEYFFPPPSSECLSKRLSLEDWRPMKGALNISSLEETASTAGDTRKIMNETSNFYDVMLYKLKSLKSCSVLKSARKEKSREKEKLLSEQQTFKYLKNTPEVKQKLDFINKLDEEISEAIDRYKAEREERLKIEFEMCKIISEHKLSCERDTELFLKMCNFEQKLNPINQQEDKQLPTCSEDLAKSIENLETESVHTYEIEDTIIEEKDFTSISNEEKDSNCVSTNFIRKNIYAAKEGMMASFALTDEEKTKISEILKDIDEFQLDDAELVLSSESLTKNAESSESTDDKNKHVRWEIDDNLSTVNAFTVPDNDQIRIGEINTELEKFAQDEKLTEKISPTRNDAPIKNEEFWKKYALDQSLKDIDAKLEKLYESYIEDEEKLKRREETTADVDHNRTEV